MARSKKPRTFNTQAILTQARAGNLRGTELSKAIKMAEQFGSTAVLEELKLYRVDPMAFAGDAAPPALRKRVAQGISALKARGHSLNRTMQMFKKHGVIETINRIATKTESSANFAILVAAGLTHLTAEAEVLDYPDLPFSEAARRRARERLPNWGR